MTRRADRPAPTLDRRRFLASMAAAGGMMAVACDGRAADDRGAVADPAPGTVGSSGARLDGWGVQLYTLRDRLADDLEGTLEAVAAIGYEEVELFQLHGLTPRAMRDRLDAVGLRAASNHYAIGSLRGDLDATLEGAVILGQALMVVPSIPSDERSADGLARIADDLSRAGERAREAGLRVGYHNHDWELRPMADGVRPIDLLLDRADPTLVDWQMDVFWTVHGGGDPLTMLRERSGRVTSIHVKDRAADGRMVDVGAGVVDFAAILADAESRGLMHAFVEHDRPDDSLGSVRASYRHLSALTTGQREERS